MNSVTHYGIALHLQTAGSASVSSSTAETFVMLESGTEGERHTVPTGDLQHYFAHVCGQRW